MFIGKGVCTYIYIYKSFIHDDRISGWRGKGKQRLECSVSETLERGRGASSTIREIEHAPVLALVFIRFWETRIYTIDRTNSDDLRGINLLTTVCMILILLKMFIGVMKELRRARSLKSLTSSRIVTGTVRESLLIDRSTWSVIGRSIPVLLIRSISYAWKPPGRLIHTVTRVV